jgi:hypothetical protein
MLIGFYILCAILSIKSQELFELAYCEESHMLFDPLLFTQKSYKWNSWGGPKGRSIEPDFCMKETIPATCFLSQIFPTLPFSFPHGATSPSGPGPPQYRGFTITLRHTTFGNTLLDGSSALRRDLYQTTHSIHKRHSCSRRDSYPQSQQAKGRRSKP